ncbi:MAG: 3'-5' exonuclease [Proteobacteria bacterium]|nr:3'-5' exonuclease [Pseudomonadota bacterium]HQR03003.1 3'-5' exonuclease [Rhodocyclaceae bacterium]
MTPVLVFDIETIPDVAGLRTLHDLPADMSDVDVAELAFQKQRVKNGSEFLPHYLQRVTVISFVLRSDEGFKVVSLAEPRLSEAEIVQMFFKGIEKYTPQLVSWNGGGFDLPVLHYRSLVHGVVAPRYWETGENGSHDGRDFKWNNYLNRYHARHLDLMDLLALYQPRANAPLDDLAKLMGFPGKLGMDGSAVWKGWLDGRIDDIRDYCETDVVNTYLVYLRFQKMRGQLSAAEHDDEVALVRSQLAAMKAPHWQQFLAAWGAAGN